LPVAPGGERRRGDTRRALREVNVNGVLIPDHVPEMIGGSRAGSAHSIAYMKALLKRANEEFAT
jgi:mannonate dehydratase